MKILVIAGHGGVDSGAIDTIVINGKEIIIKEARANLNVALHLEKLLKKQGFEVIMFRKSHQDPNYAKNSNEIVKMQMEFIKKYPKSLVINIHHNAGGGEGAEVWAQIKDENGGKSKLFGEKILEEFKKLPQKSRGVKFKKGKGGLDYYGVLRAATAANSIGVICEYAFVDSPDAQKINTLIKQQKEAEAIFKATYEFLKETFDV